MIVDRLERDRPGGVRESHADQEETEKPWRALVRSGPRRTDGQPEVQGDRTGWPRSSVPVRSRVYHGAGAMGSLGQSFVAQYQ